MPPDKALLQQKNQPGNGEHAAHQPKAVQDQNPELLQWRANVLLDEMMLGAIDVAAGDSVPARALSSAQNSAQQERRSSTTVERTTNFERTTKDAKDTTDAASSAFHGSQTHGSRAAAEHVDASAVAQRRMREPGDDEPLPTERTSSRGAPANRVPAHNNNGAAHAPSATNGERVEQPEPGHGTEQWLFAAEQRYQQIAARQQAKRSSTDYDGWSMAADADSQHHYGVAAAYSQAATDTATAPVTRSVVTPESGGESGPSRNGQPTGARTGRKRLRSNLLPRLNVQDSQSVQQEMGLLQNGIEAVLPVGHESRERAQHLLQKAYRILQEDPTRSAEVDYYLQQVRTIVQRVEETVHWSNLYYRRLHTYLFAWLALSIIVVGSRYLYATPMSNWIAWLTNTTAESLLVYNLLTITAALFFGALGGGIGALLNMMQHARMNYGFFDRKYGLRGLILPVIGALGGLILCVIFGLLYALLGLDPTVSVWFGLLPALIALALAASQEYFYGVRDS